MRLRQATLIALSACALTAVFGVAPAAAKVACLSAATVTKATGFAAASAQPMNMGARVVCVYSGSGGQVTVTYAVGQPMATFKSQRAAGWKAVKGVGDDAYSTSAGVQATLYGIVAGKSEFVINGSLSLAKETALGKAIAASLRS